MNKQQLANKIWESANQMRSKIEANEYKDYILGFIFYKYLSDKEVAFLLSQGYTDDDIKNIKEENQDEKEFILENTGYFIAYENLFSTWLKKGKDFDVSNVRDALSAFARLIDPAYKKVFDGIFKTLETALSKLGDSSASQTKSITALLNLIKDIPMQGRADYDVLGFIYEYLIGMFAANAGKKAGEFYTPHEVSILMSEIVASHLKDRKKIEIYDPTSGSGSLLINIGKSVEKHNENNTTISYYAQELKENTYNLTRMNLIMRGIKPANIITRNADTLEDDWPYFDENDKENTYNPLYVDAVVSNPPYSQNWDPTNKENDPRYARFGVAPKSKADYAFLLHDLYHLKPDGIMTIVLPHGVLFRGGEEGEIRKNLIEFNHIDTIIGLPANIFFGTGIPTIIMVLRQKRENTDILIIDASKDFIKDGKNNKLRASDIKKISDTIKLRVDIPKYSRKVSKDEIAQNGYNLNIPRYIDSSENSEEYDIYATIFGGVPTSELARLDRYWGKFSNLKNELFKGNEYLKFKTDDIKEFILSNQDTSTFKREFKEVFLNFSEFLYSRLISNMLSVDTKKEIETISDDIFKRLENLDLINKYDAYELLDEKYNEIANDLEVIQNDGFEAVKKVDPNIIYKDNAEVQDGFVGRIIPFSLIYQTKLSAKFQALQDKKERLSSITNEYDEIFNELSSDDREILFDVIKEDESGFVNKDIPKKIKSLQSDKDAINALEKLLNLDKLIKEKKSLKKQVEDDEIELARLAKESIENLSDDEAKELLDIKWIKSLIEHLNKLPTIVIDELARELIALQAKYETTFFDLQKEIDETSAEFCAMIDELELSEFDKKGFDELKRLLNE